MVAWTRERVYIMEELLRGRIPLQLLGGSCLEATFMAGCSEGQFELELSYMSCVTKERHIPFYWRKLYSSLLTWSVLEYERAHTAYFVPILLHAKARQPSSGGSATSLFTQRRASWVEPNDSRDYVPLSGGGGVLRDRCSGMIQYAVVENPPMNKFSAVFVTAHWWVVLMALNVIIVIVIVTLYDGASYGL